MAKNLPRVPGVDEEEQVALGKQLERARLQRSFARLSPCLVGMEACGGAHYWARVLAEPGHGVRLMAPAFVKPYLQSNQNDQNEAEVIGEAVQRPGVRFVAAKKPEQQSVLHLHHGRQLLARQRVAQSNQVRGILLGYGVSLPQGVKVVSRRLSGLLEDGEHALPVLTRSLPAVLKEEHDHFLGRIKFLDAQRKAWSGNYAPSQRLQGEPVSASWRQPPSQPR